RVDGEVWHYLAANLAAGEGRRFDLQVKEAANQRRLVLGWQGQGEPAVYWKPLMPLGTTEPKPIRLTTTGPAALTGPRRSFSPVTCAGVMPLANKLKPEMVWVELS